MNRLFPVVALLAILSIPASARIIPLSGNYYNLTTNPPTADLWCNGGQIRGNTTIAGTELCQDSGGNFIPTTPGTQNLGSSLLPYANIYSVNQTVTGSDTSGTAGTTGASGTGGTAASQSIVLGLSVYGKTQVGTASGQNTGVNVSTIVPVNSSYETVISSGGPLVLTSTPNISTTTVVGGSVEIPSGTFLVISSTAATNSVTFQDAGTLTGSQLQLGAATRAVSQYKTLTLIYDATDHFWREIAYGNN